MQSFAIQACPVAAHVKLGGRLGHEVQQQVHRPVNRQKGRHKEGPARKELAQVLQARALVAALGHLFHHIRHLSEVGRDRGAGVSGWEDVARAV